MLEQALVDLLGVRQVDLQGFAILAQWPDHAASGDHVSISGLGSGGDGLVANSGFLGRGAATKSKLLSSGGGNARSEAAVARGLAWLAKQQKANGAWIYDGSSRGDTIASTGMGLLPFLAAVVTRYPDIPVLAAGGITDGRSLAAALAAGADGAWLGTALLATPEAVEVHDVHKRLIVESDGADTVFTRAYDIASGLPWPAAIGERVRRNRFTDQWAEHEAELRALPPAPPARANPFEDPPDPDTDAVLYGQGAGAVTTIRPAGEVVRNICDEAEAILRARPPSLLT